ncbi:MAG: aminotransferase class III-fold pyridoxal phosphate-dependent enzyme [Desulfobacterales bacterium]|nr:aminotransferase class III-fold pyridoxal phosphate-dependent enzyme [Desulfobacterales bacterium]
MDPGRGRQPVPGLHGRDRRQRHGPLPPPGRRGHQGPGRPAAAHVRHRLLLHAADSRSREKLASLAPGEGIHRVYFGNSGAEAVEAAFKLARWHTKRELNIAFFGAFHGRTMGALSLTASKTVQKKNYNPLVPGITHIPYAYCYRCAYNLTYPQCEPLLRALGGGDALPHHGAGRRGGRHLRRADPGRRGLHRPAAGVPPRVRRHRRASTASSTSWTKCSPAWGAPARCSRSSISAWPRTSWRSPRGSPRACRSGAMVAPAAHHGLGGGLARLHVRRQPAGLPGRAGDDRAAGGGARWPTPRARASG